MIPEFGLKELLLSTAATTISTARRSVAGIAIAAVVVSATVGVAVVVRAVTTCISKVSVLCFTTTAHLGSTYIDKL